MKSIYNDIRNLVIAGFAELGKLSKEKEKTKIDETESESELKLTAIRLLED